MRFAVHYINNRTDMIPGVSFDLYVHENSWKNQWTTKLQPITKYHMPQTIFKYPYQNPDYINTDWKNADYETKNTNYKKIPITKKKSSFE